MRSLYGFTIGATDGDIGTVKECYFDDVSYTVRFLVIDTAGWLTERQLLLSPMAFRRVDWKRKRIAAALTKAQAMDSPHIGTSQPVSRQHETEYYGYYQYDPYWEGSYLWGASPYPYHTPGPALSAADLERGRCWVEERTSRDNPHLRSSRAESDYYVQAADGDVGPVEDFLLDDRSWAIRYMIVDTSSWRAGGKVMVALASIQRVEWDHSKVHVTVTREQIRSGADYDPARPIDRAFESQLSLAR